MGLHGDPWAPALGRLGFPILSVEGNADGYHRLVLPRFGHWLPSGERWDAQEILVKDRRGILAEEEPEHPYLYARQALVNRDTIARSIRDGGRMVMLRRPGSDRAALVDEKISAKGLEKAGQFLGAE